MTSEIILNNLDDHKETIVENADYYFKLSKLIKSKIVNGEITTNLGLISRLDDIYEDIVSLNVNMKILKNLIDNDLEITESNRENERRNRVRNLRNNNLATTFWFLLSFLNRTNQSQ